MAGRRVGWGLAAGAAALAALWWTVGRDATAPRDAEADARPVAPAVDPASRADPAPAPDPGEERPEWLAYREERAFRDELRDFFARHRELDAAERDSRADAIRAGVEARERGGRLLPQEALMLRLALVRATEDDPAVLEHEIETLTDAYEEEAERAFAERAPDPRDVRYQERQAGIAREVMALEEIPDGLSREDYLRERLRDLRLEVYAGGEESVE